MTFRSRICHFFLSLFLAVIITILWSDYYHYFIVLPLFLLDFCTCFSCSCLCFILVCITFVLVLSCYNNSVLLIIIIMILSCPVLVFLCCSCSVLFWSCSYLLKNHHKYTHIYAHMTLPLHHIHKHDHAYILTRTVFFCAKFV